MKQATGKGLIALVVALMFVLHVKADEVCPDTVSQGGENTASASYTLHDSVGGVGGVSQSSASFQSAGGYIPQTLNGCNCTSCDDFVAEACVQLQLSRQTTIAGALTFLEGWVAGSGLYGVDICADGADGAGASESCAAFVLQNFQPGGGNVTAQPQAAVRVRKEVHAMTVEERTLFTQTYRQAWDAPDSELQQLADDFLANFSQGLHNNGAFLPWHRGYVLQVENILRGISPNITIPYWNWSLNPLINQDPIWGSGPGQFSGDGGTNRCVADDGPFGSGSGFEMTNGGCLQRQLGGGSAASEATVDELFTQFASAAQYDNFRNRLEHGPGMHDSVHCLVGGTMCSARASNDPIFFLHHANVDRIWAEWQELSEAHRSAYTGNTSLNDLMPASPYTPRDLLDIRHLPAGGGFVEIRYEVPPDE